MKDGGKLGELGGWVLGPRDLALPSHAPLEALPPVPIQVLNLQNAGVMAEAMTGEAL